MKEYTIQQIEAENLYPDDGRVPHVAFGFGNAKWLEFKRLIQPGDKIVELGSSAKDWENLAGRAGYAIIRGENVVKTFITLMN